MSDSLSPRSSLETQQVAQAETLGVEEEFEEITSDEVDRIVAALDDLIDTCHSENIKYFLEEAAANIFHLVYEQEATDEEIPEAA